MIILSIFPSGRITNLTKLGEFKVREYAEEFPTIIYMYTSEENTA